jgi:hypothetical protein
MNFTKRYSQQKTIPPRKTDLASQLSRKRRRRPMGSTHSQVWYLHPPGVQWNNLDPNIQVSKNANAKGKCETTFDQPTQKCPTNGPWRVQFNPIGNTNGQLGQITLISKNGSKYQRCVYVSTLIGGIKTGKEHSKPNSSKKYCY